MAAELERPRQTRALEAAIGKGLCERSHTLPAQP